jgi:hypothetical protein
VKEVRASAGTPEHAGDYLNGGPQLSHSAVINMQSAVRKNLRSGNWRAEVGMDGGSIYLGCYLPFGSFVRGDFVRYVCVFLLQLTL